VFAGEIALAQERVAQQFATAARSVQLVNDERDLDSRPLASLSGFERALAGIAGKYDVARRHRIKSAEPAHLIPCHVLCEPCKALQDAGCANVK
jgi:hypothetical protein